MKLFYWALGLSCSLAYASCSSPEQKQSTSVMSHDMSDESGYADSVNSGLINPDTMKSSPHRFAMNTIAGNHIHIEYGSPGVKGRIIWGGLVPYKQVWASGAHNATKISFSDSVTIDSVKIPAGVYGFFTIPDSSSWTLILNKNYEQHLADQYDQKLDLVRLNARPILSDSIVQRLTYTIEPKGSDSAMILLSWEKLRIPLIVKLH